MHSGKNTAAPRRRPEKTRMRAHGPQSHIFKGLNDAQQRAVRATDGPLLVLAGAGSGKTKVLTHRIAHLVGCGTAPREILAVTFTNKAAGEMKERVLQLLAPFAAASPAIQAGNNGTRAARAAPLRVDEDAFPWIGTFHALGAWLLRREGSAIGIPRNFSILDEEGSLALMKETIKELGISVEQFQPPRIRSFIEKQQSELVDREEFRAQETFFSQTVSNIWELYEAKKQSQHALDFDDLIVKTVALFRSSPETLKRYQERWRYINIDEYQDTNHAQYTLANLLAQSLQNICVVGDIDQAIYSWRNADFRNILNFERDYPAATVVTLEENYRSTKHILDTANAVIAKNTQRKPKNLFTKKLAGRKPRLAVCANETEEADFVAREIRRLFARGVPPSAIAVLYRTNVQSRAIEEALLKTQIPYQVLGVKFYSRKEIKDVLAYVRAARNPDDAISVARAINTPPRGIGKVTLLRYLSRTTPRRGAEERRIASFERILGEIRSALASLVPSELVRFAATASGYKEMLSGDATEEGLMRWANIEELITISARYDRLPRPDGIDRLLEDAALMSEQDTPPPSGQTPQGNVRLMTVHAAKGLEFPYVFITGLEEGLFPHARGQHDELQKEEERRLFYVALTRAKEQLILTSAIFRTIFGERQINELSSFLADIPEELIELDRSSDEKIIDIDIENQTDMH